MGLGPISVELTDFNRLELLRDEEERLTEELAAVEKAIRDAMLDGARREFLMSLSPYYASQAQEGVDAGKLREMEARRQLIGSTLDVIRAQREAFEQGLGAGEVERGAARRAARRAAPGARSSSFESFEDYRQARG
jgi:hypothetical protein